MADRRSLNDDANLSRRLHQLGDKIRQTGTQRAHEAEELREEDEKLQAQSSNMARGFQLSSEFVAGVLVGGLIGWAIDRFVGSTPWGLIVCLLLGFGAGTLNVMRSAGLMAQQGEDRKRKD